MEPGSCLTGEKKQRRPSLAVRSTVANQRFQPDRPASLGDRFFLACASCLRVVRSWPQGQLEASGAGSVLDGHCDELLVDRNSIRISLCSECWVPWKQERDGLQSTSWYLSMDKIVRGLGKWSGGELDGTYPGPGGTGFGQLSECAALTLEAWDVWEGQEKKEKKKKGTKKGTIRNSLLLFRTMPANVMAECVKRCAEETLGGNIGQVKSTAIFSWADRNPFINARPFVETPLFQQGDNPKRQTHFAVVHGGLLLPAWLPPGLGLTVTVDSRVPVELMRGQPRTRAVIPFRSCTYRQACLLLGHKFPLFFLLPATIGLGVLQIHWCFTLMNCATLSICEC